MGKKRIIIILAFVVLAIILVVFSSKKTTTDTSQTGETQESKPSGLKDLPEDTTAEDVYEQGGIDQKKQYISSADIKYVNERLTEIWKMCFLNSEVTQVLALFRKYIFTEKDITALFHACPENEYKIYSEMVRHDDRRDMLNGVLAEKGITFRFKKQ